MNIFCPHCGQPIAGEIFAREVGRQTSKAKARAARANGKLGGRPRKKIGRMQKFRKAR